MTPRPFDALKAPLRTVLAFSLAINLALLAPSIFMLQVFDRVLTTRSVETLLMLGAIAACTLLLMGVLEFYRARALGGIGLLLEQRQGAHLLGQLVLASARDSSRTYLDGMRDLGRIRAFLGGPGVIAFFDAPWTLVYLLLIYLFHPALGLLATACTGWLVVLAWLNERLTRGLVDGLGDSTRRAGHTVDTALRGAEVVTALGMQPAMTQRWSAQTVQSHHLALAHGRVAGAVNALSRVSRQFVQVLMLGFGAWLVIHEHATPGVMLATTIILSRALAPVETLIGSWKGLAEARGAYRRLQEVFARPVEGAVGTELPRPEGRLSVEGLSYLPAGAQRPLLRAVSFEARPGEVVALVGPSGSGKTTLLRLLAGVLRPSAGSVRLDGAELGAWDPVRLGAWIGYVPQEVTLFDGTVSENIARLGPVDSPQVLAAARQAHAHEMLLRLPGGYDTPVGELGRRLSGGQRQRVALARALYGDPPLVLLDEPDASLDAEGEQALLDALRGLKARGATVLVATQRRGVLSIADRAIVLKDGQIERVAAVETAGPREVIGRSGG